MHAQRIRSGMHDHQQGQQQKRTPDPGKSCCRYRFMSNGGADPDSQDISRVEEGCFISQARYFRQNVIQRWCLRGIGARVFSNQDQPDEGEWRGNDDHRQRYCQTRAFYCQNEG